MSSKTPFQFLHSPAIYYWLLGMFFLWILVGVFPLYNTFEGDSLRIIAGSSIMYNEGWSVPPALSYQYGMQPAIIYMIVAVKHLLPFLSCNTIYCLLSVLAALIAIPLAVTLVHRLTGFGKTLVLAAFMLLPETYAITTYPSSSSFSYMLALWAFILIVKEAPLWKPLAIMCLATFFRIDIVIVYPVIFFLFLHQGKSVKKSIALSALAAIIVVAFIAIVYTLLQANPFKTLAAANTMNDNKELLDKVIMALYSYYNTVNLFLVPIGIACVLRMKKYRLLLVAIVPMLLIHYFYRLNGGAAKHYLYLLPFVAILTSHAIHMLISASKRHKWLGWTLATGLAIFLLVSLRFDFPDMPWRNSEDSVSKKGPNFSLFTDTKSPRHWEVGIGTSLGFFTEDELMIFSGHFFYPFYIHKVKSDQKAHICKVRDYLDQNAPKQYAVVAFTWEDISLYPSVLLEEGYLYRELKNRSYEMFNDKHQVELLAFESSNDLKKIVKVLNGIMNAQHLDGIPVYVITQRESFYHPLDILCAKNKCRKLMEGVYEVIRTP